MDIAAKHKLHIRMENYKKAVYMALSLPKTVYFNFRCFPFATAKRLPVLVAANTKLMELHKGILILDAPVKRFMIKIGVGGTYKVNHGRTKVFLEGGSVCFRGNALISQGCVLANSGNLTFGKDFYANTNCTIWCSNEIVFGNECLLGWNVMVRDTDGHKVIGGNPDKTGEKSRIEIGDHCWLCSDSVVLKGAGLGDNSILAYGSLLTGKAKKAHVLMAGVPAVLKKEGMDWEH